MLIRIEIEPDGYITVTDDCREAAKALERQEAVIGLRPEESWNQSPEPAQSWSGVSYYITDLEALEDTWYVREAYYRFHGKPLVIASNERFVLREMTAEDAEGIADLYRDSMSCRFCPLPGKNIKEIKEKIQSYIQYVYGCYGCGMWVMEEPGTGKIIGRVGIEPETQEMPDGRVSGFFLGYLIAKGYRRKYLAEEACRIAISFAWNWLWLDRLYCKISEQNAPSIALAKKLGFQKADRQLYVLQNKNSEQEAVLED